MTPPKDPDAPRTHARRRPGLLRGQGRHLMNAGYLSFIVFGVGALTLTDWVRGADGWIWLPAVVPVTFVIVGAAVQTRDEHPG
ncbi:hypothetical protein [Streptomyces nitrosporeus]|uniref:hypothetical protein n=1 Tax=Streptomyces nitrosporeus TaxID=28894 RepID=UPI0039A04264